MIRPRPIVLLSCLMLVTPAWGQLRTPPVDTVVVCASELLPAAVPWITYRRRQGHRIALLSGQESSTQIKRAIEDIGRGGKLKTIVLVGDSPPGGVKRATDVETFASESAVIAKWGAEPTFASDNAYADLDGDGIPEVALGRICADSPDQLRTILDKVMAFETKSGNELWRRQVNLVAGIGGFGALTDKVLETAAKKLLTDGIPAGYQTSMTQASWRSAYSPDPRRFQAQTIERLNQGCLAWVYLGHGQRHALDSYRTPLGGLPILTTDDVARVRSRQGQPIAVFLSCYAGAFDAEPNCLGEDLLAAPGGPVAVIAGSSITMPYAMTVLGKAMLFELFEQRRATLGEVFLHAKRSLAERPGQDKQAKLVDQLAALFSPDPDLLHAERLEHVRLFHLLGDPLLRIPYPREVTLELKSTATAGDTITVEAEAPLDGVATVELVCRRDRLRFKPTVRTKFLNADRWLKSLQADYERANDPVWVRKEVPVEAGSFTVTLEIPAEAWGPNHVRVFVQGPKDFAMGAADLYVQLPPQDAEESAAGSDRGTPDS